MGYISLLPAGLMLGFENRSVGGTKQDWKRKMGLLLAFCSSVQQETGQDGSVLAVFSGAAGCTWWLNSKCPPDSFLIPVLQAACSSEVCPAVQGSSESLTFFLVPFSLSPRCRSCLPWFLPREEMPFSIFYPF